MSLTLKLFPELEILDLKPALLINKKLEIKVGQFSFNTRTCNTDLSSFILPILDAYFEELIFKCFNSNHPNELLPELKKFMEYAKEMLSEEEIEIIKTVNKVILSEP